MKSLNTTIEQFTPSIFSTMTQLANNHQAINLGQGFPDFDGPPFMLEALSEASKSSAPLHSRQYAPAKGAAILRHQLIQQMKDFYGLDYNADKEVLITNGATEALFLAAMALLNPGDEVLLFEPFYDSYMANILMAQAVPRCVELKAPEFAIEAAAIEELIGPKTKFIYWNNPHNPTGRVFGPEELQIIADLAIKHDLYIISDEVYEFLTYDNIPHIPLAGLPGMRERVVTISSIGKTMGVTGLKIGWMIGPEKLINAFTMVHQFNTFCVNHPAQYATAKALESLPQYRTELSTFYQKKRDYLFQQLKILNYNPIRPQGSYFIICQLPAGQKDVDFCTQLIVAQKVVAIPVSPFYQVPERGEHLIRFCFAKKDEVLKAAVENLKNQSFS